MDQERRDHHGIDEDALTEFRAALREAFPDVTRRYDEDVAIETDEVGLPQLPPAVLAAVENAVARIVPPLVEQRVEEILNGRRPRERAPRTRVVKH